MSRFVDLLIELDRETRLAAEQHRVRQTEKVLDAQRQAKVAQTMKNLGMPRGEAEWLVEIESIMDGSDWASRQRERA